MSRSICMAGEACCRSAINKVARLLTIQHWQASGTRRDKLPLLHRLKLFLFLAKPP